MATTKLRLLSLRNTQSENDQKDLKILISPESISLNTVGGVTAPRALDSADVNEPLIIRIRSKRLTSQGRGLERCVIMEPTTGEISSGSWLGEHLMTDDVAAASNDSDTFQPKTALLSYKGSYEQPKSKQKLIQANHEVISPKNQAFLCCFADRFNAY